ncbi:MAG TPA: hypothetical protein PK082_10740, partial [Phycisphaerae bacterium]|nr:hypothetical protein [Phycisphaerae bacterium]
ASSGLTPTDIREFFVTPDTPATLHWQAASVAPSGKIAWEIRDYAGAPVSRGEGAVAPDGRVEVPVRLPRGYYELRFDCGETFGLVILPPHEGQADPFFAIDAALSWLELRPPMREALVDILRRSGIAMARERLNWGEAARLKPDQWRLGGPRAYDQMRRAYQQRGISVLDAFWGVTGWMGASRTSPYPQNLWALPKSFAAVPAELKDSWGALEVWNEPDLIQVPADQYASMAKAVVFSLREAGIRTPVGGGVWANAGPREHQEVAAANGLLDCADFIVFHHYDRAATLERSVRDYFSWLRSHGRAGMPLWLDECGWPWVMGPSRAPIAQDTDSAMEIAAKAVEARACGVARYFPFVYPFYEEGGIKNFAMMGREVTPLRSMAAYAQCIRVLDGTTYAGDLADCPGAVLARVFAGKGEDRIVVLYSGRCDPRAAVRLPFTPERVEGADGRTLATTNGAVPIPDGLAYVYAAADQIAKLLQVDTPAAKLLAMSRKDAPPPTQPKALVLQFLFDKTPAKLSALRYLLDEKTASRLPIHVRIHNLSAQAKKVSLTLQLPAGGKAFPAETVEVPAAGFADVQWAVDAISSLDPAEVRMVKVTSEEADPLAIPFLVEADLSKHLARHAVKIPLPIAQLDRWKPAIASHGKMTLSVTPEGCWRMDVTFTKPGGAWAYPAFEFPRNVSQACPGATGL